MRDWKRSSKETCEIGFQDNEVRMLAMCDCFWSVREESRLLLIQDFPPVAPAMLVRRSSLVRVK
jgi:hypothetical protein